MERLTKEKLAESRTTIVLDSYAVAIAIIVQKEQEIVTD